MRKFSTGMVLFLLAACGAPTDRTAAIQQENLAAREAAQESRIINPAALACVRANATEAEWAIIETETGEAANTLQSVLRRESTQRCFAVNNVVIYI